MGSRSSFQNRVSEATYLHICLPNPTTGLWLYCSFRIQVALRRHWLLAANDTSKVAKPTHPLFKFSLFSLSFILIDTSSGQLIINDYLSRISIFGLFFTIFQDKPVKRAPPWRSVSYSSDRILSSPKELTSDFNCIHIYFFYLYLYGLILLGWSSVPYGSLHALFVNFY